MAEQEKDILQTPILNEGQRATKVGGVKASSIWVSLQMISKLLNLGKISDSEVAVIADARTNFVEVLKHSFDVDYDEELNKRVVEAQRRQALLAAAQERARAEARIKAEAEAKEAETSEDEAVEAEFVEAETASDDSENAA